MSALILSLAVALWFGLGWLIWRLIVRRCFIYSAVRESIGVVLACLWMLAPWVDEWLGAREFKRLCDEMPEVKFYGPVAVGSGLFYDNNGHRRLWAYREVLDGKSPLPKGDFKLASAEGRKFDKALELEFKRVSTSHRIRDWPSPVLEEVTRYGHEPTRKLVREARWLGSPGGWIKRGSSWGNHAPYTCFKEADSMPQEAWITY